MIGPSLHERARHYARPARSISRLAGATPLLALAAAFGPLAQGAARSKPMDLARQTRTVKACYTQSRGFRYQNDDTAPLRSAFAPDYWQLPSQTERTGCGDCEDLSIWLYAKLLERGVPNVRLFIGKHVATDRCLHAWVMWFPGDKAYILDPTSSIGIFQARHYRAGDYQPYYSFYRGQRWYHYPTAPGSRF